MEVGYLGAVQMISIHAFRVEGDCGILHRYDCRIRFQSTPSVWKATKNIIKSKSEAKISIHAFRVEGDLPLSESEKHSSKISIHAFRVEGDRAERSKTTRQTVFQSTPSVWKATVGGTMSKRTFTDFNPRLPCGRRLDVSTFFCPLGLFQSTPSVWKATSPSA